MTQIIKWTYYFLLTLIERLSRVTKPPGGKPEDAQSIMSTWEIKPNRQDKRNSTAGPPSHASRGPATAAVDTPAPSAKPLQQQLPWLQNPHLEKTSGREICSLPMVLCQFNLMINPFFTYLEIS